MTEAQGTFAVWGIVELMGHVRMAGKISEQELFGAKVGRIDIPGEGDSFMTQYFGGSSLYRLTPTTEDTARMVAAHHQPEPVYVYELRPPTPPRLGVCDEDEDDEGDDDNERW